MLAWIVATGMAVLSIEVLGRRGQRRLAAVVLAVAVLAPAAFQDGLRTWAEDEAETWSRRVRLPEGSTTTSEAVGPVRAPAP